MKEFKKCHRCGKQFTTNANLRYHLNRKNPCKCVNVKNGETLSIYDAFRCSRCSFAFSTNQALMRHLKRKIPCNPLSNDNNHNHNQNEIHERLKKLCEENEQTKSRIKELEQQVEHVNNKPITHTTNNTQNVNVFNINVFGKEDMTHITPQKFKKCFRKNHKSVETLFFLKYLSDEKPENHNIYISNLRSPYIHVYSENGWEIANKNMKMDSIYYNLKDDLSAALDGMRDTKTIDQKLADFFSPFVDDAMDEEYEKKIKQESCNEMVCMAYNRRHRPMANRAQMEKTADAIDDGECGDDSR